MSGQTLDPFWTRPWRSDMAYGQTCLHTDGYTPNESAAVLRNQIIIKN